MNSSQISCDVGDCLAISICILADTYGDRPLHLGASRPTRSNVQLPTLGMHPLSRPPQGGLMGHDSQHYHRHRWSISKSYLVMGPPSVQLVVQVRFLARPSIYYGTGPSRRRVRINDMVDFSLPGKVPLCSIANHKKDVSRFPNRSGLNCESSSAAASAFKPNLGTYILFRSLSLYFLYKQRFVNILLSTYSTDPTTHHHVCPSSNHSIGCDGDHCCGIMCLWYHPGTQG